MGSVPKRTNHCWLWDEKGLMESTCQQMSGQTPQEVVPYWGLVFSFCHQHTNWTSFCQREPLLLGPWRASILLLISSIHGYLEWGLGDQWQRLIDIYQIRHLSTWWLLHCAYLVLSVGGQLWIYMLYADSWSFIYVPKLLVSDFLLQLFPDFQPNHPLLPGNPTKLPQATEVCGVAVVHFKLLPTDPSFSPSVVWSPLLCPCKAMIWAGGGITAAEVYYTVMGATCS